jgi:hypothetical protein
MYIAQGCLSNTKPGFNKKKKTNSDFDNYFTISKQWVQQTQIEYFRFSTIKSSGGPHAS